MIFQTEHNLGFTSRYWGDSWEEFKIGTCFGQWRSTDDSYEILSILNTEKGNGHVKDVFQWFEYSCIRDKKDLKVLEVWNNDFKRMLIRNDFIEIGDHDTMIKYYSQLVAK